MAEAALTSIAKSALQLFTSLAKDEFLLLWNSEKDLKKLQLTIDIISCLLQDADKLQSKADAVQICLSRLRNVMYDAEDLFDALAAQVLRKKTMGRSAILPKEVRLFFSKSNQLGFIVKTAHEVKSLRESLDGIKSDMDLCGFKSIQNPPVAQQVIRFNRDKTHSFVDEEVVIGRDEEREAIVNLLLSKGDTSDDRSFSVVAVIGFGGLGKTTVAQLVYNDESVQQGFDVRLWACINDLSNLEQVLIEIIASREGRLSDLGLEKLQGKLREIIGGKNYLLVLDDVWDEDFENWRRLENILRCGKIGSKVLVTTRSKKVAKCLDASEPCCVDLEVLSEESAWSLFVKKAFHKEELNKHPELEPLGKKIVSSCMNVPLAIIIVGSLLRQREKKENIWSDFLDNELKKALINSDGDKNHKSIKDVLMVSYNDLLPNLKLCFAYCSLFPKDYNFDKDELVRLWLAQGFIKPFDYNEQCLEVVGEEYFFLLVERCFFQEVKEYRGEHNLYGYRAKMHDLLHDVAIDVAKTESILLEKDSTKKGKRDSLRHISITREVADSFDYGSLVSDPNTVRTLLFHDIYPPEKISQCSLDMSLKSFRMLRTLNLKGRGIINVSGSIGELIHLRYLDLSSNGDLKHLPSSICKLHHLMTLNLRYCKLLEKLPLKIEKLVSLRQLYIGGCDRLDCLPPGLTALTSLFNLDRCIVHRHSGGLGYLKGLDNLRGVVRVELPTEGWPCAIEDAKRSNMSKKHKLDGMVIEWKEKGSNTAQKMGKSEAKAVLEALEPHQRLEYLEIGNYGGEKLPGWFCMLKNVKKLCLYRCENVEYVEDEMKGNLHFPSLETLKIKEMKNLQGWWRHDIPGETQRPCLAKVSRLTIKDCPELKGKMPLSEGIEYLKLSRVDVKLVMELIPSVNPNCSSLSSLTPFDNNNANSKLHELKLNSIKGLVCLPEERTKPLTALQRLCIKRCSDLRWVSRRGLSHLTVLKELSLESNNCGIGDVEDDDEKMEKEVVGMPWKALRGLETLRLAVGDRHLHQGLHYLSFLTELYIKKWKGIQLGDGETGGVQLPSKALQNLRKLSIGFDDDESICHLPKAGIQYLHSLKALTIEGCKELYLGWKTLLVTMKLQLLSFNSVGSVIDVDEDMVVEQPTQLWYLLIQHPREAKWAHDIPWKSLASSLVSLYLGEIGEMEELQDVIQHLTSLRELYIFGCEKERSIPKWFPQLTSLRILQIWNCSEEVKRRCERERGEDWPLIRHIPDIRICNSPLLTF